MYVVISSLLKFEDLTTCTNFLYNVNHDWGVFISFQSHSCEDSSGGGFLPSSHVLLSNDMLALVSFTSRNILLGRGSRKQGPVSFY